MPGTTPSSGWPSSFGTVPRPVPTFDVSPSIFRSSSFENVTWLLWNFDGWPANSCIREPSGAITYRIARSIFDGSMYRSKQSSGSLKWLSASLIGYGSVFSGIRRSSQDLVSLGNCTPDRRSCAVAPIPTQPDVEELSRLDRRRRDRHRPRRVPRPAGPARRQAGHRPLLPRARARPTGDRGVQLPARGRRRHDAAARLRVRELGAGLRRLRAAVPDLDDAAPASRGSRRPRSCSATCSTRSTRRAGRGRRPAGSCSARSSGPRALGYTVKCGVGARVLPVPRLATRRPRRRATRTSRRTRSSIEDYHILQTTRDEYLIREIRNGMDGAGIPVEFSKGEAGKGQHEINLVLRRRARDGRPPRRSTRTAPRRSPGSARPLAHVHGEVLDGRGRLVVPHPLEPVGRRRRETALMWDADGARPPLRRRSAAGSAGCSRCARELAWMFAPTVNSYKRYQPESWAPTALAWGLDNRTCGFRVVGHGATGYRVEIAHPRRRLQPLPRVRGHDRRRPARHRARASTAADALRRQRVRSARRRRACPHSIVDAIDALERSDAAVDGVRRRRARPPAEHRAAGVGSRSTGVVTDWERRRSFEQF